MKSEMNWILQAIILSLHTLCMASSLDCSNGTIIINGIGSSVLAGVMGTAGAAFATNRSLMTGRNVVVSYTNGNIKTTMDSVQGLVKNMLLSQLPMFGAGEAFFQNGVNPKPQQLLTLPVFAEAMVLVYNVREIPTGLNLSMDVIAGIFSGAITRWNDTAIQRLNSNSTLPGRAILPVARWDMAAQTRLFTAALALYNTAWANKYGEFDDPQFVGKKCCNSTTWENDTIAYFGNKANGMIGLVLSIPYSIGYAAMPDAAQYGLSYANLVNPRNIITKPTLKSVTAAMNYWADQLNETNVFFRLLNPLDPQAYPFATFQSILVDLQTLSNFSCCQIQELVGFIDYLYDSFDEATANSYQLVPISNNLEKRVRTYAFRNFDCGGSNMYDEYVATLAKDSGLEGYQVAIIVVAALLVGSLVVAGLVFCWRKSSVDDRIWLINSKVLDLAAILTRQSMSSLNSSSTRSGLSSGKHSTGSKHVIGGIAIAAGDKTKQPLPHTVYEERTVLLMEIPTRASAAGWRVETKELCFRLSQRFSHASLTHLHGVSSIGTKVFAVQEYCSKGTLHYVLKTSRFEFSDAIKCSMATDISEAMVYLHSRGICHGLLNSISCYVANSWVIKVANWMANSIMEKERQSYVDEVLGYTAFDKADIHAEKGLIELLFIHPSVKSTRKFTIGCDVFSFGMLLFEVINRCTPYQYEVQNKKANYQKIIKNKFQLEAVVVPEIHTTQPSPILERLARGCLIEEVTGFESILQELQDTHSMHAGGITDILMDTMETMLIDIEKQSKELDKMSGKMKDILNQVLPPSVCEKFILGQPIEPEYFEQVSVYFSEIIGFATISSQSTPSEVMNFLNDLWIAFDAVIEQYDCYKADTIGDCYMICSGLPNRNGIMHMKYIADLALALLDRTANFVIRHLPSEGMKIRIGLNTGPVTTGVVGTKMPQYCVFGDTVNTASRMESTSLPGKIQASETMAKLLTTNFPQYKVERRGEVEVKGKGLMTTYWLESSAVYRTAPQQGQTVIRANDAAPRLCVPHA